MAGMGNYHFEKAEHKLRQVMVQISLTTSVYCGNLEEISDSRFS